MEKSPIFIVSPSNSPVLPIVQDCLSEFYDVQNFERCVSVPGSNSDPKRLLKPTTPVIALTDEIELDRLESDMELLTINPHTKSKRHPVLFVGDKYKIDDYRPFLNLEDDLISASFDSTELKFKIASMISRADHAKKLERDLNEASDIALLSMAHSSELGEISRFILRSYHCMTYEDLFEALFETVALFSLECSALIIVDDTICVKGAEGYELQKSKDKMLKYHDLKRIVDLGKEVIVSYNHISLMIHNMPLSDEARCGRLLDNLAVLGNCFEARVKGIHSEQEADAASRAKTMFLATMSHELRTPMNSVIGFTQRLIKKLDGRLSQREENHLQAIKRNGDHLLGLINDILDMSKIEIGQMEIFPEPVNVTDAIQDVFDQLLPIAINNNLSLNLEIEPYDLMINVDAKRFMQVILNLVSNAIKYTEEGSVKMSLAVVDDEEIGEAVSVAVIDTGIGISDEDKEKLFGDFVQIDSALSRKVEGTGLGLAISMFFTKMHGGRIDVESTVGEGSKFTLLIPTELPDRITAEDLTRQAPSCELPH